MESANKWNSLSFSRTASSTERLLWRDLRLASPRAMMKPESTPNPTSPLIWVLVSCRRKECKGGRNQYQTPRALISVVTIDGPRPQYQAEKTTAAQTVKKGLFAPSKGEIACRSSSARTAVSAAKVYCAAVDFLPTVEPREVSMLNPHLAERNRDQVHTALVQGEKPQMISRGCCLPTEIRTTSLNDATGFGSRRTGNWRPWRSQRYGPLCGLRDSTLHEPFPCLPPVQPRAP